MSTQSRRTLLRNIPGASRELADLLQAVMVAEVLRPTYEALGQYVLQAPIVGADGRGGD